MTHKWPVTSLLERRRRFNYLHSISCRSTLSYIFCSQISPLWSQWRSTSFHAHHHHHLPHQHLILTLIYPPLAITFCRSIPLSAFGCSSCFLLSQLRPSLHSPRLLLFAPISPGRNQLVAIHAIIYSLPSPFDCDARTVPAGAGGGGDGVINYRGGAVVARRRWKRCWWGNIAGARPSCWLELGWPLLGSDRQCCSCWSQLMIWSGMHACCQGVLWLLLTTQWWTTGESQHQLAAADVEP